jgi:hypothetical protein
VSDDSDETEGRKLYRAHADRLANAQVNMARRKVKLEKGRPPRFNLQAGIAAQDCREAKLAFVLVQIARGRYDSGRPLDGELARQYAREVLTHCGMSWKP